MPDVDREEAVRYIIDGLDPKPFRAIWDRLPQIVGSMIEYDLHFMRLTGVIAPDGGPGPNEYDEDEAFEYVYDAWLGDNPGEDDEDMTVALLLDCFMELWHEYLWGRTERQGSGDAVKWICPSWHVRRQEGRKPELPWKEAACQA